jgi:hypothetical protein
MLDTLQPQSLTSYIKEIRKVGPLRKPAIIIQVRTQVKATLTKMKEPVYLPDLPFEEWNLPPQQDGYIKCSRYDFL